VVVAHGSAQLLHAHCALRHVCIPKAHSPYVRSGQDNFVCTPHQRCHAGPSFAWMHRAKYWKICRLRDGPHLVDGRFVVLRRLARSLLHHVDK
jgi:hypothetical protein